MDPVRDALAELVAAITLDERVRDNDFASPEDRRAASVEADARWGPALAAARAALAQEPAPTHDQNARFAIDGAIQKGYDGVDEPPDDHWLTEYWMIGKHLAARNASPPPADDLVRPVAWQLLGTDGFPVNWIALHEPVKTHEDDKWRPLYPAAAIEALEGEVARLGEALGDAARELGQVAGPVANRIRVYRADWQARIEAAEARAAAAEADDARLREWLDNNTTFYNVDADWPVEGPNIPILAQVSKRIWYHATDDETSYPFSAAIDAARGAK